MPARTSPERRSRAVRERLRERSFPWFALGAAAVLGIPVSLMMILANWLEFRHSPPTCYGIGWGCTPDPVSIGMFVALAWGFAVACAAGILALTELFWERVATARSILALVVVAAAVSVLLVVCGAAFFAVQ